MHCDSIRSQSIVPHPSRCCISHSNLDNFKNKNRDYFFEINKSSNRFWNIYHLKQHIANTSLQILFKRPLRGQSYNKRSKHPKFLTITFWRAQAFPLRERDSS
ncbi:hypothetical protein ACKWTF_016611 [Chironomus riparius]